MKKEILEVETDARGRFVERVNRFLGTVDIGSSPEGAVAEVHVRDPGRLEEIVYPGNEVLLRKADKEDRKTNWDLIAGKVGGDWVFVNSGYHRRISKIVLDRDDISPFSFDSIRPEARLGDIRIDFLLEKGDDKMWLEVKGCTLAEDGVALFPDAPTVRGTRHVQELREAMGKGDRAGLMVLVFRSDAECFAPKEDTDPEFARAFRRTYREGLEVHPLKFNFEGDTLFYVGEIPVCR